MTNLEQAVLDIINNNIEDDYAFESFINDLINHGCVSGMVGELITYNDTTNFYKVHQEEIDDLLTQYCDDSGLSISQLFGKKWDRDDPFAKDIYNQNLLAWFGFEETAFNLARKQGIEI